MYIAVKNKLDHKYKWGRLIPDDNTTTGNTVKKDKVHSLSLSVSSVIPVQY